MKRKIAIAFAGLLLMLTASFAPIAQAPVPGCDIYVTMGGKVDGRSWMYVQGVMPYLRAGLALPLNFPYGTREPYLSPMHLLENICFGTPVDLGNYGEGPGIPDIIPITKQMMVPIVHYQWIAFRNQWWRFTLMAIAPGSGVIFLHGPPHPLAGDVDVITFNNDTGVFWGTGPEHEKVLQNVTVVVDPTNPDCTTWHEVSPTVSNMFHLTWTPMHPVLDTNMNGVFEPCDNVLLTLLNSFWTPQCLCHVKDFTYGPTCTLIVNCEERSPLAGEFAAASGGCFDMTTFDWKPPMAARFPTPGADGIPGTWHWGDPFDGFGDGQPDPKGSSILMLPMVMYGNEYNASTGLWDPKIFVPMPLVLTTAGAYDHVAEPGSFLYCTESKEYGEPWEWLSDCAPWNDPKAFVKVTYVAAWSNLLYSVNPDDNGDCTPDPEAGTGFYYTIDAFWEYKEKKVREDVVIADINCDQQVTMADMVIAALAFGAQDEGLGLDGIPGTADDMKVADPNYDARADFDCNGLINIIDLVKIGVDFGKTIDP